MATAETGTARPKNRALAFDRPPPLWAVALALSLAGVIVLFWDAIGNLWSRWGGQQELSHSYFIPVVSAWLVWINRERVKASVGAPSWLGVGLLVAALCSLLLGQLTSIYLFQHVGLVIAIAALVAGFGGWSLLRTVAAPIAFLLFAVPPPFWVITVLSWKFQLMSSVFGVWMIQLMGIPVYLSGNVIDLGAYQLQVAEACSGLRYLFPFLSLGVMSAYIYRGPIWHKLVIVAATIPITIAMNSFRIAITGFFVQAYGPQHAEGALHFFEGWVVFLLCLLALFGVVALLGLFRKPRQNPLDSLGSPALPQTAPSAGAARKPVVFASIIGALVLFFGLSQVLKVDSLITPERADFAGVPAEFEGWRREVRPLDPTVAEVLAADDTIVLDLMSPQGNYFNLYMAYLEAQRDGRSWHSPRQCIPGGGWQITSHELLSLPEADGSTFNYNRLVIENRGQRQLVYYWYDQRGRTIANEFIMKFWLIFDAVTRNRSDGALVRIMTAVGDDEPMAQADARLHEMREKLKGFLPASVQE